ncbi:MAG: hypothetical protein ABIS27_04190 [Longimicrobiales bacterium]
MIGTFGTSRNPVGTAPCVARIPVGAIAIASVGAPVVVVGNIGDDGRGRGVKVGAGAVVAGATGTRVTGAGPIAIGFVVGFVARVVDETGSAERVIDGRGDGAVQLGG